MEILDQTDYNIQEFLLPLSLKSGPKVASNYMLPLFTKGFILVPIESIIAQKKASHTAKPENIMGRQASYKTIGSDQWRPSVVNLEAAKKHSRQIGYSNQEFVCPNWIIKQYSDE
jgi:hypothetical protein